MLKMRCFLPAAAAGLFLCPAAFGQTNNVPIPYEDASGVMRNLPAQCSAGAPTLCSFQSTPQINSNPVTTSNPMPVVITPGSSVSGSTEIVDAGGVNKAVVNPAGQLAVTSQPNNAAGAYGGAVSVGTTATVLVAANTAKTFLDIQNGCTTQNMTIAIGGNTARVLTPLATYTREAAFVPADAVTATVASGSCTAYVAAK